MAKLEPFVTKISESFNIAPDMVFQLQLALDEALANSVNYAYPEGTTGIITLEAEKNDEDITFKIIDNGVAFDPTKDAEEADISSSAEERAIGGLGIFLIKQMMDEVCYERLEDKNILTLRKKNIAATTKV